MEVKALGPLGGLGDSMDQSSWFRTSDALHSMFWSRTRFFFLMCNDFYDHHLDILPPFLPSLFPSILYTYMHKVPNRLEQLILMYI